MRKALDHQVEEKEKSKAAAYAEFLKEKDLVDKVQCLPHSPLHRRPPFI